MSAPPIDAEGVTNPSIDDLLTKTDSKYKLVLYSAKRARQINAYYSQLGEGLLEYVGPLVDTHVQEKPLSIALREINDDLLTCEDIDPAELAAEEAAAKAAAADASTPRLEERLLSRRRERRVVLGVSGGIAAYKAAELLRRFTESGHDVTVVPTAAALHFVGAPTWSALSGKPVSTEVWDERPRGPARPDRPVGRPGRGRAGHRGPAGQGRARPGRRPAHQHPAHRPVPGRVRARDAHRDVGARRDAGERRDPA